MSQDTAMERTCRGSNAISRRLRKLPQGLALLPTKTSPCTQPEVGRRFLKSRLAEQQSRMPSLPQSTNPHPPPHPHSPTAPHHSALHPIQHDLKRAKVHTYCPGIALHLHLASPKCHNTSSRTTASAPRNTPSIFSHLNGYPTSAKS